MNAASSVGAPVGNPIVSLSGTTSIEVRHASDPEAARHFDTAGLRSRFLVESLFRRGQVALTYSHIDRVVVGGAMPLGTALPLEALKPIGSDTFLRRRELGVFNIGGPGQVVADGMAFDLARLDSLYVAAGTGDLRFESADPAEPAKFYLVSTPAHASHPTTKIALARATKLSVGSAATANARTIHQVIHPDICASCQLSMGFTVLEPGSVWNTMPSHRHERRCEIYFYFDLAADARVLHLMGEPGETRHLIVSNEQAVLSPVWSIHSGAGTRNYAFVWAMAGENQDYTDMDMLSMSDLR